MHRYCILLLLAVAVEPCYHGTELANFELLANQVIAFDANVHQVCQKFTSISAREVFGRTSYRLEVLLPEYGNGEFFVKLKHRTVLVIAHVPKVEVCDLTYADMKILPKHLQFHKAAWTYRDGMFILAFPYKKGFFNREVGCDLYVDDTTINVRRGFPDDPMFSDDDTSGSGNIDVRSGSSW